MPHNDTPNPGEEHLLENANAPDPFAEESSLELPFQNSHAFLVGINAYQHVSPLRTAINDVKGLADRLKVSHGYQVHGPYLDSTRDELLELFTQTIPQLVKEEDRIIFYFAGHGIALDGDEGPNGYLVPVDAQPGDRETLIPMALLHESLHHLSCKHGFIILDCCFSGAFKWSTGFRDIIFEMPKVIYEERFWRYVKDSAWQVLTSAAYDQKAVDVISNQSIGLREEGQGQHSPFAYALYNALDGAADVVPAEQGDGVITASELYAYMRDSVEDETQDHTTLRQSPSMFNLAKHDKGEFIFLNPRHRFNLPPIPDRNPFMGLSSYNEADSNFFFGRDRVTEALIQKVLQNPLTVVSGASGTGKSSVIKAGLLPQLRKQDWELLAVIRPGKEPMAELKESLPKAAASLETGQKSLIIIDQYEELITQTLKVDDRKDFEAQLAQWLTEYPQLRIILSVRSDFEPQFESKALAPWWQQGRYVVPGFSFEEIGEVITKPALQSVLFYEPAELADRLQEDVSQAPGALPLLSFTLSELYYAYLASGRQDRALTEEDYEKIGGVIGALRSKADEVYLKQNPERQNTMRKLMLRMVSLEGGELAGKRVFIEELHFQDAAENQRVQEVADQLVEARLLLQGKDKQNRIYIEPAHDALVRAWARLWEWIKTVGEEKISLQYKLSQAVTDYETLQDRNLLWHNNPRLELLKAELDEKNHSFNLKEERFVRESIKKRTRRRQQLIGGLLTLIAVLSGLVIFAFAQQKEAKIQAGIAQDSTRSAITQRQIAEAKTREAEDSAAVAIEQRTFAQLQQKIAEDSTRAAQIQRALAISERDRANQNLRESNARALAATARQVYPTDNTLALNLAYEATQMAQLKEAFEAFADIANNPSSNFYQQSFYGHQGNVTDISYLPNGKYILSVGRDSMAILWEANSGKIIQAFPQHTGVVISSAVSPNGSYVATGNFNRVSLWKNTRNAAQPPHYKLVKQIPVEGLPAGLAFSADNQQLLTGARRIKSWNLEDGSLLKDWGTHAGERPGFTDNLIQVDTLSGKVYTGGSDGQVRRWSPEGELLNTYKVYQQGGINAMALVETDLLALAHYQEINVIAMEDRLIHVELLEGHLEGVQDLAVSKEQRLFSVSWDRTIKEWDFMNTAEVVDIYYGHDQMLNAVACSPVSNHFVTGGRDQLMRMWQVTKNSDNHFEGPAHPDYLESTAVSQNGKWVVSVDPELGRIWETFRDEDARMRFRKVDSFRCEGRINSVACHPDNKRILVGHDNGYSILQHRNGKVVSQSLESTNGASKVDISRDGKLFALISQNDGVKLYRFPSKEQVHYFPGEYQALQFSRDGQYLVGSATEDIVIWNLARMTEEKRIHSGVYMGAVAISPDGRLVAAAYDDGLELGIWNRSTGELFLTLDSKEAYVLDVTFSPDGKRVLFGNKYGELREYSVFESDGRTPSGQQIGNYPTFGEVYSINYAEDASFIFGAVNEVPIIWSGKSVLNVMEAGLIYRLNEQEKAAYRIE